MTDGIKVGDTVMWCSANRKPLKATVVSVGRKLVKIQGDNIGYRRDNSLRRSDQYEHEWIMTLADFERHERRILAREELLRLGVDVRVGPACGKEQEILEAIKKVLP